MNLNLSKYLLIISFFPIWIFRSNLNILEILMSLLVFLCIPFLIFLFLFNKYHYKKKKLFLFFLSIIIFYGIDNHLGLKSPLIGWNADLAAVFIKGPIITFISVLIIFLIIFYNQKIINVIFIFIITIAIFNLFDQTKSSDQIVYFNKENNQKFKQTTVILILDEMSGFNSIESQTIEGKKFVNYSEQIFSKFNFNIFPNAETSSSGTIVSIPNALNFLNDDIANKGVFYVDDLENYFQNHKIKQNLLFNKFKSISVFQNMYINYCEDKRVYKCDTYNPFKQIKFIEGYKNNIFSKIFSVNHINGSIIGYIYSNILFRLRLIDLIIEPLGEKITFKNTLNEIIKDIYSENYDLIFSHIIVPHTPYGYTEKCRYNGKLSSFSSFMSVNQKIQQHNIERLCVLKFVNEMLNKISVKNKLNDLQFILMSDHGSKIKGTNHFSSILAYRDKDTIYELINNKITIQSFLKNKFDN